MLEGILITLMIVFNQVLTHGRCNMHCIIVLVARMIFLVCEL